MKKLMVYIDTLRKPSDFEDSRNITIHEFALWAWSGKIIKHFFRYKEVQCLVYRINIIHRPFLTALALRLLSCGRCSIKDDENRELNINALTLVKLFSRFVLDFLQAPFFIHKIKCEVERFSREHIKSGSASTVDLSGAPVYLRTDLIMGLKSGGSVGHTAGVLNNLDKFTERSSIFISIDFMPTVRDDIETRLIHPGEKFWNNKLLVSFDTTELFEEKAYEILKGQKVAFIYQRYSLNNYTGLKIARSINVPFILEYNGSMVWAYEHWAIKRRLKNRDLSLNIEILNCQGADLVVVVSQPLKDDLIERGIDANKILVNPNCVDPKKYSPDIDGTLIRDKLNFQHKTVVGFIGSFGLWHGAEVLAKAIKQIVRANREIHFLFIGNGITMPEVRSIVERDDVTDHVTFVGYVRQEEGPLYMAACDILTSPTVPNDDGTPFFGSPTKLFEYMAMGKAIVASDLEQIGEVLQDQKSALLTIPGDVHALADGIIKLADDPLLRDRLGKKAREEVCQKCTWEINVRRVIEKLKTVLK